MSCPKLPTAILKIAMCERCLQYPEDCECCTGCGCVDGHDYGCPEMSTHKRNSAVVPRRGPVTIRGLGRAKTPLHIVRVDGAEGHEATGRFSMAPPTLRSPKR